MKQRTPKNRRVRQTPLRRRKARIYKGVLAVSLGVLITVGIVEAVAWAHKAPMLSIGRVDVVGARRATAEAVRRLADVDVGSNLFKVDVDAARARLVAHPWIASAEVRLTAVDHARISVVEHQPVALVALGHLYYADAAGRLFKRYAPGESVALPVITGLARSKIEADDSHQVALLAQALRLVDAWPNEMFGTLSEVHVHEALGLTAVLANSGMVVVLGEQWRERMPRLRRVLDALEQRRLRATRIDLSGTRRADQAVVRLVAAEDEDA